MRLSVPRQTPMRLHGLPDGQRRRAADLLARVPRCGFMGSQTTKSVFERSQTNPDAVAWTPRRPKNMRVSPTPGLVAGVFAWGTRRLLALLLAFSRGARDGPLHRKSAVKNNVSSSEISGQKQCKFGLRGWLVSCLTSGCIWAFEALGCIAALDCIRLH